MKRLLLLLALLLAGCGDDAACRQACERPFDLLRQQARMRATVWDRFPEPQRSQARGVVERWNRQVADAAAEYVAACTPGCSTLGTRNNRRIECRRGAASIAAWKRCGGES